MRKLMDRALLGAVNGCLAVMMRWRGTRALRCGRRMVSTFVVGGTEYTVTSRELRHPDHYSREELLAMLAIVRREEQRMRWRCPDPVARTAANGGSVTLQRHRDLVLGLARALNGVVNYAPVDRQAELNDVVLAAQLAVMEDGRG